MVVAVVAATLRALIAIHIAGKPQNHDHSNNSDNNSDNNNDNDEESHTVPC